MYTLVSNEPNAFAVPFRKYTATSFIDYLYMIFPIGPVMATFLMSLESFIRSGFYMISNATINSEYKFNPHSKVADIGIPYIKCFITTKLLSMITDDEIDAVLMHEIGHNAPVLQLCILSALKTSAYGGMFATLIPAIDHNNINNSLAGGMFIFFTFLVILLAVIEHYYDKRFEIYADTFAVNMGYGSQLASALRKMNKYGKAAVIQYIKDKHMTEKEEKEYRERLENMRQQDVHMRPEERNKFLKDKTKEYQNIKQNNDYVTQSGYAFV